MPSWIRTACLSALICAASCVAAHAVQFTAPNGPILRLSPGQTGTLALRVQSALPVQARLFAGNAADAEYEFTLAGAVEGCAALEPQTLSADAWFDPTASAGDLECVYSVRRALGSINDLSIDITPVSGPGTPASGGIALRFGVVPDLQLDVRQDSVTMLPDGRAQNVVTLTVHQSSSVALSGLSAGYCWIGSFGDFLMDGNIPDGCDGPRSGGGFCFDGGYGFQLPTISAHESTTCRIQLTSRDAYEAPLYYPIELITYWLRDTKTGGRILSLSDTTTGLLIDLDLIFSGHFDQFTTTVNEQKL